MSLWIIWLIAASVLMIIEILSQMVWTFCISVGCLAAAIASVCSLDLPIQIICVAIVALITFAVFGPRMKRWIHSSKRNKTVDTATGMDALIGRKATVTHEIKPGEVGRVRIDGDSWQAIAPKAEVTIPRGSSVIVTAYDSIILSVK